VGIATACGAASAGVGLVALAGWVLDVHFLRGPIPGEIDVKANTAIALALAGASLWLQARGRPGATARACAAIAGLIGFLSLVQYLAGVNLGIDELLFQDPAGGATVNPGRLAPQSAAGFAALGLALVGTSGGRLRPAVTEGLALVVFTVCLAAVLGYAYGGGALSTVSVFSPIALPTALGLLILSAGVAALGAGRHGLVGALSGEGVGSVLARRLVLSTVLIVPVVGWLRLQGQLQGLYSAQTGVALYGVTFIVVFSVVAVSIARPLNRAEVARRAMAIVNQQFAAIVEASHEAIFSVDADGTVTTWNGGAERLYQRTAAEMVGAPLAGVGIELDEAAQGGSTHVVEGVEVDRRRHERPDGSVVDVELTLSPLLDDRGEPAGYAVVARDITERNRAEQAEREAREGAERANLAKSEFLSRMSHELRTPLNTILGFGQLLELDDPDEGRREQVGYILKAGRHLLALIDEVLQVSRIEAGTLAISPEPVDVAATVRDVLGMVGPMAQARGIRLSAELDAVNGCHVRADHQRLKQVLLNLLSNAVKYNREGGTITIGAEQTEGRLRLHVADTGYGIPAAHLHQLFTPFERLGAEHGTVEGTGLGLVLSRRLVELMDGSLEVESEAGAGATFTVELPLAPMAAEPMRPVDSSGRQGASSPDSFTVLYVEDNISNFRLIEQVIGRRPGIKLLPAMLGNLGIDLALQHAPDLILLDLHLPDLPGEDVLHRLKSEPATSNIPVVILSADATPGRLERLLEAGAYAYVTKPLDVREFAGIVERALDRGKATA